LLYHQAVLSFYDMQMILDANEVGDERGKKEAKNR
jgi:hypothetical protein